MKKTLITLLALAGVAVAFDDTVWNFEGSLASETGAGYHTAINPQYGTLVDHDDNAETAKQWVTSTATYVDSGLVSGTTFGDYTLNRNLGKAVTLSDGNFIRLGDAYWSNGDGKLGTGTTASNWSSYTIMAWVRFDDFNSSQSIFGTGNNKSHGIKFGTIDDKELNLCAKNIADNRTGDLTMSANTWHNVAVSYDKSTSSAYYYLDGVLVYTDTDCGNSIATGGDGAAIGSVGRESTDDLLRGDIAELKILSGAYNQTQILAAAGLVPEPTTATLSLLALAGLAARRRRR